MTNQEKLAEIAANNETIAENVPKVYEAGRTAGHAEGYEAGQSIGRDVGFTDGYSSGYEVGKASMIDQSKIIEKTVSGKIISVDDVSEIPHEVSIQLSSDTVTDFSGVTVKALGKNLATAQQVWKGAGDYVETVFEGRNVVSFYSHSGIKNTLPVFKEKTAYTFSFDAKVWSKAGETNNELVLRVFYTDGSYDQLVTTGNVDWKHYTLTTSIKKTIEAVGLVSFHYTHKIYVDINTFQLEKASISSEYVPYNEKIYTSKSNGVVEGIKSTSPNMTIFTDNADVYIVAGYHKSYGIHMEQRRKWGIMLRKGIPNPFAGAFRYWGWNDETFDPICNIVVSGSADSMFQTCGITWLSEILQEQGVTLDTSQMTSCAYMFYAAEHTYTIPAINFENCTYLNQTFSYCQVQVLDEVILKSDGSNTFTSPFIGCSGLVEIRFRGVIGQNGLSFQNSTKLSKASITSIINALSSTTSGLTVTLSKTAVTSAFGSTTATEWTNLIATKSNWTISLV